MKITYIVGNGFDRQMGLASAYSDFLEEYIKPKDNDSTNIKEFKKYLSQDESRELWSDAEYGMGQHLCDFSDASIEDYTERVTDFEEKLIDYLTLEQEKCCFNNENEIKTVFTDFLFNSYHDVLNNRGNGVSPNHAEHSYYSFVSFNYTDTLDRIIATCVEKNSFRNRTVKSSEYRDVFHGIHHVHGTLEDGIIMGVNDESQLKTNKSINLNDQLRWTTIKPRINSASGNNWDAPAKAKISESDIVAIYGVSFGETDKMWWHYLKEWLSSNGNHKLIWFVRDSQTVNPRILHQMISYDINKRTELLNKLGFTNDDPKYNDLLDQVFIIRNTERLNLKDLLHPNNESSSEEPHKEYAFSV